MAPELIGLRHFDPLFFFLGIKPPEFKNCSILAQIDNGRPNLNGISLALVEWASS